MTSRRTLVAAFGAGMLVRPFELLAQHPPKIRRVGVLFDGARPDDLAAGNIGALRRGMRELGYIEGKNLAIEWRFADGQVEHFPPRLKLANARCPAHHCITNAMQ